jgi:hypothetical protein
MSKNVAGEERCCEALNYRLITVISHIFVEHPSEHAFLFPLLMIESLDSTVFLVISQYIEICK